MFYQLFYTVETGNNSTFCYEVGLNHPVGPGRNRKAFKSPSSCVFVCLCPLVKAIRHLTADLVSIKTRQTFFRSFLVLTLPTKITKLYMIKMQNAWNSSGSSASEICWGFKQTKHLQHFIWVHEWLNEWMNNTFASFSSVSLHPVAQCGMRGTSSLTRSRAGREKSGIFTRQKPNIQPVTTHFSWSLNKPKITSK